MIKFRWYYDIDKDEKFLNDMTKKGYALKHFFMGFYTFEKCEPNEYTYRIDLIQDKTPEELKEYIDLITESGAEFIQRWGVWAFFRKKGEFDLYTDLDSQISLYSRIEKMFITLLIILMWVLPGQIIIYIKHGINISLCIAILAIVVSFIFGVQAIKCYNKIKKLKENK